MHPIRVARLAAGLSQRQLAHRVNVEKVTVSGWETGRYAPSPQRAKALCRVLPTLSLDAIYRDAPGTRQDPRDE
ncbi:helix-turn-helix transcriptional regulator [Coralloluteibacterium thermophilus]|uniref:Helix-turn-helix transcriptional regulator n=1 Tax=Coralloluteibacterium thermophilum TaxID=2707049 RepID=A0ABV9NLW4_9GAMM